MSSDSDYYASEPDEPGEPGEWKDAEQLAEEIRDLRLALIAERRTAANWRGWFQLSVVVASAGMLVMSWLYGGICRKYQTMTAELIDQQVELREKLAAEQHRSAELDDEAQQYCDDLELTKRGVEFVRIRHKPAREPFRNGGWGGGADGVVRLKK